MNSAMLASSLNLTDQSSDLVDSGTVVDVSHAAVL
jgi:hypothetical protein